MKAAGRNDTLPNALPRTGGYLIFKGVYAPILQHLRFYLDILAFNQSTISGRYMPIINKHKFHGLKMV